MAMRPPAVRAAPDYLDASCVETSAGSPEVALSVCEGTSGDEFGADLPQPPGRAIVLRRDGGRGGLRVREIAAGGSGNARIAREKDDGLGPALLADRGQPLREPHSPAQRAAVVVAEP